MSVVHADTAGTEERKRRQERGGATTAQRIDRELGDGCAGGSMQLQEKNRGVMLRALGQGDRLAGHP